MRSPGSVPEEERDWTEKTSIKIDDGIEYASQALDAGMQKMNEVTDAAIEKGTQSMSNAIGAATKSIVDFSKEKFASLTDKATNLADFKEKMAESGSEGKDSEFEITDESMIKSLTEPDQLEDSLTVTMAEHSTEERLGYSSENSFANLLDKRQQEAEAANAVKLEEDIAEPKKPTFDRKAEVDAMSANLEAQKAKQKQADEEFEELMMQPNGRRYM